MVVLRTARKKVSSFVVGLLFCLGLVFSLFALAELGYVTWFTTSVDGATGTIDPNANGTVSGTLNTCGAGGNYDCLNDAVRDPTSPSTSGDYVDIGNNAQSYYQMGSLTNVSSGSQIDVKA